MCSLSCVNITVFCLLDCFDLGGGGARQGDGVGAGGGGEERPEGDCCKNIRSRRAVKTIIGEDMIVRNENLRRGEEVRRSDLATGKTDSSLAFSSPQKILSSA